MIRRDAILCLALGAAAILGACDRDNMRQRARLKPFEATPGEPLLGTDLPPLGTIPRNASPFDPVERPAISLDLLQRGRVRFDTYCAPCHARDGYGDGIVARHGFPQPPSLHDPAVRARPDDHYYAVISDGLGKMPSYGALVRPTDRWAIVDYIRALQLSQNAPPEFADPAGRETPKERAP